METVEWSTDLSSLLSSVQFLLDLLQWGFLARRRGRPQLGPAVEGRRLQDDLEGLTARPLAQLDHLHVPDVTQVQVHHTCCEKRRQRETADTDLHCSKKRTDFNNEWIIKEVQRHERFSCKSVGNSCDCLRTTQRCNLILILSLCPFDFIIPS